MGILSKFKRIIVLFCCTLLLFMSIFMSYSTAVHADDDYNLKDGLQDVCLIVLGIGGILVPPAELTLLGFVAIVSGALGAVDGVESIIDHITDNGDGTYTIDEDFIQAVLDAAEQLEEQGFTDANVERQGNYLYNYKWSVVESYMKNKNTQESHKDTYLMSKELTDRVAGCKSTESGTASNGRAYSIITCYAKTLNSTISGYGKVTESKNGTITYSSNTNKNALYSITSYDGTVYGDTYSASISFGGNFPIFTDDETMQHYLETGQGYKNAENYRPTPLFRRHSSYTPIYSGGAVTVNRTVINNINQKIAEVDSDDSLTDDQKIEILQQYIYSGGTSGTGGGGSGSYPGDTDYDDNKDLPSGTDLTDTNSWLKKIYLKVCQIYDRMNSTVEAAEDAAFAKIQESLDEIIEQLKKIKHWTAVDTVIDGVDAVADWLDLIHGVISDADEGAESAVTTIADALDDSAGLIRTKFPFSIPWDLFFLISFFSAEPEVPYFEIPFLVPYYDFEYTFIVDFSDYQWLSDVIRPILLMSYAIGLLTKTPSILSIGKEE